MTEKRPRAENELYIAHTLIVDREAEFGVRVLNPTKASIQLTAGEKLGSASLVTDISVSSKSNDQEGGRESANEHLKDKIIAGIVENTDATVPPEYKKRLTYILKRHSQAISMNEDDLGRTRMAKHQIDTGDARPMKQSLRRIPQTQAQAIDAHLDNMLRQKLIRPSTSEYASNVVLVKKKDNAWRFCVDYRKVNDIARKDAFPLPRINECLDTLTGSVWFTTIDLRSGYFQVEMDENDANKTASITRRGLFEFQVMPQGMCNSAATFQRLMQLVLAGLNYESCLVYIDDIMIFAKTLEDHLRIIEKNHAAFEECWSKDTPRQV